MHYHSVIPYLHEVSPPGSRGQMVSRPLNVVPDANTGGKTKRIKRNWCACELVVVDFELRELSERS